MSRPDPLIMSADIARVAAERPELGDDLLRALYQHLVLIEGRQPTIDELRAYVERVSCLDEHVLRQQLGLVSRRRPGRKSSSKTGRGRPSGSGLTVASVTNAHSAFRAERGQRPTQEELASHLNVAVRSLQRFLRDHDMGWPLSD